MLLMSWTKADKKLTGFSSQKRVWKDKLEQLLLFLYIHLHQEEWVKINVIRSNIGLR